MVFPLQAGHAWLSQHYRWALSRLFEEEGHTHAIILEDDMLFSPDFLTLFEVRAIALRPLNPARLAEPIYLSASP